MYPLNISILNQGLGDSNGSVNIEIISSNNIEFELNQIELNELDSREFLDLGDITYFSVNTSSGSVEDITVNVFDLDN